MDNIYFIAARCLSLDEKLMFQRICGYTKTLETAQKIHKELVGALGPYSGRNEDKATGEKFNRLSEIISKYDRHYCDHEIVIAYDIVGIQDYDDLRT